MKQNPLTKRIIEENGAGVGEISNQMIEERAKELAIIAGRPMKKENGSLIFFFYSILSDDIPTSNFSEVTQVFEN